MESLACLASAGIAGPDRQHLLQHLPGVNIPQLALLKYSRHLFSQEGGLGPNQADLLDRLHGLSQPEVILDDEDEQSCALIMLELFSISCTRNT